MILILHRLKKCISQGRIERIAGTSLSSQPTQTMTGATDRRGGRVLRSSTTDRIVNYYSTKRLAPNSHEKPRYTKRVLQAKKKTKTRKTGRRLEASSPQQEEERQHHDQLTQTNSAASQATQLALRPSTNKQPMAEIALDDASATSKNDTEARCEPSSRPELHFHSSPMNQEVFMRTQFSQHGYSAQHMSLSPLSLSYSAPYWIDPLVSTRLTTPASLLMGQYHYPFVSSHYGVGELRDPRLFDSGFVSPHHSCETAPSSFASYQERRLLPSHFLTPPRQEVPWMHSGPTWSSSNATSASEPKTPITAQQTYHRYVQRQKSSRDEIASEEQALDRSKGSRLRDLSKESRDMIRRIILGPSA